MERAKKNQIYRLLQSLDIPVPSCALLHSLGIRQNLIIHLSCVEVEEQKVNSYQRILTRSCYPGQPCYAQSTGEALGSQSEDHG